MRHLNIIGPAITKLRSERGWTQEVLAARLQCQGANVSRDMLANIESGRTQVPAEFIIVCQKVFRVRIILFFPKAVQELDEMFATREINQPKKTPPQHRR